MGKDLVATGMEDDDARDDHARIEGLDLSVRSYNVLKSNGIHTVHQLFSLRKQEFLSLGHLTPPVAEEIRERLIAHRFLDQTHLIGPFTEDDEEESS